MIVVSDSSPLIALISLGKADLLSYLYQQVLIPDAVWHEVIEQGAGKPGVEELKRAGWLERRSASNTVLIAALQSELDAGESEAIALAVETRADLLLIDERLGRKAAERLGLRFIGSLGVLVEAKHAGHFNAIKPLIDRLRDEFGFRLSDELYNQILVDEQEVG